MLEVPRRCFSAPLKDFFRFGDPSPGDLAISTLAGIAGLIWYEPLKPLRATTAATGH